MTTQVETKDHVLQRLRQHASAMRALGVKRIGLFGSFERDEATGDSDIDLLVEFEPGEKSFDHFMQLAFLLEDLLERRVELVTREALRPYIGPHILAEVEYVSLAA